MDVLGVTVHATEEKAWTEGLAADGRAAELIIFEVADAPAGYEVDRTRALQHVMKLAVQVVVDSPEVARVGTIMHAQHGHYRFDDGPFGMLELKLLKALPEPAEDVPESAADR